MWIFTASWRSWFLLCPWVILLCIWVCVLIFIWAIKVSFTDCVLVLLSVLCSLSCSALVSTNFLGSLQSFRLRHGKLLNKLLLIGDIHHALCKRLSVATWAASPMPTQVLRFSHAQAIVHSLDGSLLLVDLVDVLQIKIKLSRLCCISRRIALSLFLLKFQVRDEGHLVCVAEVIDIVHQPLVVYQLLLTLEITLQEWLAFRVLWECRMILLSSFLRNCIVLEFIQVILWLEILMLALPDPRSFRHWSVYLLQIELALYLFFIDVWNHVWWLYERHGEGRSHPDSEAALGLWFAEVHWYWIKLWTKSSFCIKWLNDYGSLLILANLSKVLQVYGQVLVVLLHKTQLLVDHSSHNKELLQALWLLSSRRIWG